MSKSDEKEYTLYVSIKGMNEIIDARYDVISYTISEMGDILVQSRKAVPVQVNQALVAIFWIIGEITVYICYPKFQAVSGKLSWSHYCKLLSISDDKMQNYHNPNRYSILPQKLPQVLRIVKTNQGGLSQIMMEHSDKSKCFKADHNRSRLCNVRGMRYKFEA